MLQRFVQPQNFVTTSKGVLLGVLVSCSMAAHAMDFLQAYQAAQKEDATLLAARAMLESERERLPQARALMLPNISANLASSKNKLTSESPDFLGTMQTYHTDYPSSNKTVTLRQPIYRPLLTAQFRQAKALINDAESGLALEEQNLAVRVSSAYFDALLSSDQLSMIQAQKRTYTTQLDAATKAFAAGSGVRTDIDEAKAKLDMNFADELEAKQNVAYTFQNLQTLINQPFDNLAGLDLAKFKPTTPDPESLAEWKARAELTSPQIQSLKARVEAAREEIAKAKSGHYPTLDAIAQWSDSNSESVTNIQSRYINSTIGLQLNIPLYSGGYINSQIRQAQAELIRAEENLEFGRRDLGLRVFKEFRGVTENIPKVAALEQALRSADQMILSSRKSFEAGSRTILDVMNAEQQRMVVLRDLAQARYMYILSKLRLLALVGSADTEAVIAVNSVFSN